MHRHVPVVVVVVGVAVVVVVVVAVRRGVLVVPLVVPLWVMMLLLLLLMVRLLLVVIVQNGHEREHVGRGRDPGQHHAVVYAGGQGGVGETVVGGRHEQRSLHRLGLIGSQLGGFRGGPHARALGFGHGFGRWAHALP